MLTGQPPVLQPSIFKATVLLLNMLEKMLGCHTVCSGFDVINDKKNPILFVANHFTRAETFILPHLLYQQRKEFIRSLASHVFFHGAFGKYLNALGAISVRDELRNQTIISDLLKGKNNWLIYPEGSMVKNKKIYQHKQFVLETPNYRGRPHSGAALFALTTELLRKDILTYGAKLSNFNALKKRFFFNSISEINTLPLLIVPINITYYPIRPATNYIEKIVKRFIKKLPSTIAEELHLEGNLLLHADMYVQCMPPINVKEYLENNNLFSVLNHRSLLNPFRSTLAIKRYFVRTYYRHSLTQYFMNTIYRSLQINFDHLVLSCLKYSANTKLSYSKLIHTLMLTVLFLRANQKASRYCLHPDLIKASAISNLLLDKHVGVDIILQQAVVEKIVKVIEKEKGVKILVINKKKLHEKLGFNVIRLINVCQVISNEFAPFTEVKAFIKKMLKGKIEVLSQQLASILLEEDEKCYVKAYYSVKNPREQIAFNTSKPFLLWGSKRLGVVLAHGYKSSPGEVMELATYLHKQKGLSVYGVRLAGHGTSPEDLSSSTWKDWYNAYDVGYTALKATCDEVVVAGFSTGGLLAILTASNATKAVKALITINSPLVLMNKKSHLVPAVVWWQHFLNSMHAFNKKDTYIQTMTKYPKTNYTIQSLSSVLELKKLMQLSLSRLNKINQPTLVLQASRDAIVNPKSADIIYTKIATTPSHKQLVRFNIKEHVMIRGTTKEMVFSSIGNFIDKLN